MPKSFGLILPSGEIAAASVITNPAPPAALEPRCTKCQLFENPSSEEYWHIGETQHLFLISCPRIAKLLNNLLI